MNQRTHEQGFTLVEVAIAFMVVAIGLGLGLSMLSGLLDSQKIRRSNAHLDTVTQALIDYAGKNSRLPCPAVPTLLSTDVNYGVANSNAGCSNTSPFTDAIQVPSSTATTAVGVVPWITLGLAPDMVTDGYGNMFTYLVTMAATQTDADSVASIKGAITTFSGTPVSPGLAKDSTTQNQLNACSQTPDDDGCRLAAVAALVSYGKNGNGSYRPGGGAQNTLPDATSAPEEYENANWVDAKLVVQNPALRSTFDDLVRVLSPNDILAPLSKSGGLLTPTALTRKRLQVIKSALISYLVQDSTNHKLPYGSTNATVLTTGLDAGSGYGNGTMANGATFPLQDSPDNGYIPWGTLGLPSSLAYDGWGNLFRYQVDTNLASTGLRASSPTGSNIAFRIQSKGVDGTKHNSDDVYIDVTVNEIRGLLTMNSITFSP